MTNSINFSGTWWFPEDPEKKFYANLEFVQGEGALLILSELPKGFEIVFDDPFQKLILGNSGDGKKITLYDCYRSINKSKVKYKANYLFIGHHFEKEEDIKFKTVSVQYSYLEEWLNRAVILDSYEHLSKKPEKLPLTKINDYNIFIDFYRKTPYFSFRELIIKQNAYIEIETFKSRQPWKGYERIIGYLQDFLNLAIVKTVYPLKISGKITKKNKIRSLKIDGKTRKYPVKNPDIDIYIAYLKIPILQEELSIHDDIIFPYEEIKSSIKSTLLNWLVNSSLFSSIYNPYFSTIIKDDLFIENQFLNIITTVESYHRSITSNNEIDEYSHKKRLESIIEGTPDIYKKWVSGKLRYSNEPTLRDRLDEILKDYSDVFAGKKRVKSFIYKVVNNRNSLVHQDTHRDINYEELIYTTIILKTVFELYLLESIGFDIDYIKEIIKRKKKIDRAAFEYMKMW